jgi:hypothetical protein
MRLESVPILALSSLLQLLLLLHSKDLTALAFTPAAAGHRQRHFHPKQQRQHQNLKLSAADAWKGEVVSNPSGILQGCSVQLATEGATVTDWTITVDGALADVGPFSAAIYKKVLQDAKRERFQGFRPGTIPPHLEPTYQAWSMDECARETVMEAMQQQSIRPFESCRSEMKIQSIRISISAVAAGKKKGGKKSASQQTDGPAIANDDEWMTYATIKEAIQAGWRPGQSFSFVGTNVKGQKVNGEVEGATPLGSTF